MKWREVPIGEFLNLKRTLESIAKVAFSLYADALSEKTEAMLDELRTNWILFLQTAALEVPEEMKDASKLTYKQIREATQDFFAHTVGVDRKPNG